MRARRVIAALSGLLWLVMTGMTIYVAATTGLSVLVLFSILICVLIGVAVLGLLGSPG